MAADVKGTTETTAPMSGTVKEKKYFKKVASVTFWFLQKRERNRPEKRLIFSLI